MRKEMYKIYRKSSPRTGQLYDMRLVTHKQLKLHLARGWSQEMPQSKAEPERAPEKLSYEDFSDLEKENIKKDKRSISILAGIHNTTIYAIRKIKGKT